MDNEMNTLMKEGGLKTDGATTDPVSGNDVPVGSTAEEVRDDIPANLSENEYVIPADVVKFFGVSFFEKLRAKAKQGLADMEADGRIGGEEATTDMPQDEEDDALPFDVSELQTTDEADAMDAQMQGSGFAEGGTVAPAANEVKPYNPTDYPIGFSVFGNQPATTATTPTVASTKKYVNAAGNVIDIQFDATGNAITPIPAGYTLQSAAVVKPNGGGDGGDNSGTFKPGDAGGSIGGLSRLKPEDFVSEDAVIASGMKDIDQLSKSKKVGGVAGGLIGGGMVGTLVGSIAGAGYQLAELNAKIQIADKYGYKRAADELRAAKEAIKDKLPKGAELIAPGTGLAKGFLKKNPVPPSAVQPDGTIGPALGGSDKGSGGAGGITGGGTTRGGGGTGTSKPSTGGGTMTKRGVSYSTTGGDKDRGYTSATAKGSTAPSSSSRPATRASVEANKQTTAKANSQASKAASAMSKGARTGLAKGGLMQKKASNKA